MSLYRLYCCIVDLLYCLRLVYGSEKYVRSSVSMEARYWFSWDLNLICVGLMGVLVVLMVVLMVVDVVEDEVVGRCSVMDGVWTRLDLRLSGAHCHFRFRFHFHFITWWSRQRYAFILRWWRRRNNRYIINALFISIKQTYVLFFKIIIISLFSSTNESCNSSNDIRGEHSVVVTV